jgi:hypothetical protein
VAWSLCCGARRVRIWQRHNATRILVAPELRPVINEPGTPLGLIPSDRSGPPRLKRTTAALGRAHTGSPLTRGDGYHRTTAGMRLAL